MNTSTLPPLKIWLRTCRASSWPRSWSRSRIPRPRWRASSARTSCPESPWSSWRTSRCSGRGCRTRCCRSPWPAPSSPRPCRCTEPWAAVGPPLSPACWTVPLDHYRLTARQTTVGCRHCSVWAGRREDVGNSADLTITGSVAGAGWVRSQGQGWLCIGFRCLIWMGSAKHWQKSIFATKKRFKIMKKMPKKPFYTNKNHEKCNFSTKKDQIFGLKLCTPFFICSRS